MCGGNSRAACGSGFPLTACILDTQYQNSLQPQEPGPPTWARRRRRTDLASARLRDLLPRAVIAASGRPTRQPSRPSTSNDLLGAIDALAGRLRLDVSVLLVANLLLGLGRGLEHLLRPAGRASVQEVLDPKLDPLAIGALAALVGAGLEIGQAAADLRHGSFASRHGLKGVADGVQELADAFHDVLAGQRVHIVAHGQV
mmetsp:Transcript_100012/g.291723  ORF Transcript_100012/g.291723 Transcript_100012/m.291723 type:complete len:200 (+) Transcript_100012:251-850(+)